MTSEPTTASDHPPTWKFDFPIFHPADLAAWRSWLEHHHRTERGVWVTSWKKASGRPTVPYEQLVEEAIAFGWIDSTVNTLEADGRMTDAGRAAVDVAKANGWWMLYDTVEDLIEPPELAAGLDASPAARAAWDAFPPSARKQMLWSVVSAAKPETKAARVAKIVAEAEQGRRAAG